MYKRRLQRIKARSFGSSFEFSKAVKITKWKFQIIKFLIIFILICIFLIGFYHPIGHHRTTDRSREEDSEWDDRYVSKLDMNWDEVSGVLLKLPLENRIKHVGILNYNEEEIQGWQRMIPTANQTVVLLSNADRNTTWEALYPEWIDEEQEEKVPVCPSLPTATVPNQRLDLIAVKLPCTLTLGAGNWSRDVARLHLQMAAANLAAAHKGTHTLHVLFVTTCFPTPNLFLCKDLVARQGNAWLYRPNLNALRDKLRLPVGSCELALPLPLAGIDEEQYYYSSSKKQQQREAYATILHSNYIYVCGAIVVAQSIRMSGSDRDLVILVDKHISDENRRGLEMAGWQVRTIHRIRNPKAKKDTYNEWNYSKFRLWQLTDYDKIVFIDSDLLVLRNIDFLFRMPELSATGNSEVLFNSGVMVIEPSNCTFRLLMDQVNDVISYNGGDQGYLNEIFTWWHRLPRNVNFLKHFWAGDDQVVKQWKMRVFGADPPLVHVLHYLGNKPWMCFRDYDCNWNVGYLLQHASDEAHRRWWRIHDAMPEKLHEFCLLRALQKAQIEWDRREAERGNFSDGHWRIAIKDPRLATCIDQDCDWEERLRHWGNQTTNTAAATLILPPLHPSLSS